jgi:hypothetical protein
MTLSRTEKAGVRGIKAIVLNHCRREVRRRLQQSGVVSLHIDAEPLIPRTILRCANNQNTTDIIETARVHATRSLLKNLSPGICTKKNLR